MKHMHIRLSLNKQLALISITVIVPMTLMLLYMVNTLQRTNAAYARVSESVTYANHYDQEFKERMDYSVYLAVTTGKDMKSLGAGDLTVNGIKTVNPYEYIDELESACRTMEQIATVNVNRNRIGRVQSSLENLRTYVETIDKNNQKSGNYDKNVQILNESVYPYTSIIQNAIRDYISTETSNYMTVREQLEARSNSVTQILIFAGLAVVVMAIVLTVFASRSVTRPIKELCRRTERVAKGDFTPIEEAGKGEVKTVNEIATLENSFNMMTEEIGRLVEDVKSEQENLHFTETKLLQAQINPHFLYNTLDTIVWLAEQKKTREVVDMVTSLSDFFRTTLSEGRDDVTIKEEEMHIRSYLEIQQFRYQDILDYEIHIDPDIYEYRIPKLTLQPLVENALYHGIKYKRGKGCIQISGYQSGNKLLLKVKDNGVGMTEEELELLRKDLMGVEQNMDAEHERRRGFGLANVNQRIHHYYGAEYGVFFESRKGEGTEAVVILAAKNIPSFS